MSSTSKNTMTIKLTKGLIIAAICLIFFGGASIYLLSSGLDPNKYPEIATKIFAYKLSRYLLFYLFVISGIGILTKNAWARKVALVVLVINIIPVDYYAWLIAERGAFPTIQLGSLLFSCLWTGPWFYVIYRVKPIEMTREMDTSSSRADLK